MSTAHGAAPQRVWELLDHAARLAESGRFRVEPNPLVGAVVLDAGGAVAGEGRHECYGGPHAEVAALAAAGARARGGTLLVTLEPCTHEAKKTAPCAPAVIASGVARVIAGACDPNPATRGRAAALFARQAIAYEVVAHAPSAELLAPHERALASDVPWTIAKWASSLDGCLADASGASRWISGAASRDVVHELRARVEAVVVGSRTAAADDPELTARGVAPALARPALRVVVDSRLSLPPSGRLATTARETPVVVIGSTPLADEARRRALEAAGVEVVLVAGQPDGRVDLREAWRALRVRGVRRMLLESGGVLGGAAASAGLIDQVLACVAPMVLGGSAAPRVLGGEGFALAAAPRLERTRVLRVGDDVHVEGYWPR